MSFLQINLLVLVNVCAQHVINYINPIEHVHNIRADDFGGISKFYQLIFIFVPFLEESVFRGTIPMILNDLGIGYVCVISSSIFALVHLSNQIFTHKWIPHITQVLFTFFLGVIIYNTGSFYLGVIYHMYYNLTSAGLFKLFLYLHSPQKQQSSDETVDFVYIINRSKSVPIANPLINNPLEDKYEIIHGKYITIKNKLLAKMSAEMTQSLTDIRKRRQPLFSAEGLFCDVDELETSEDELETSEDELETNVDELETNDDKLE
jgi:hypothetical protein